MPVVLESKSVESNGITRDEESNPRDLESPWRWDCDEEVGWHE